MSDSDGFAHPPPTAERYFNIARGDDPTWENMPNGPDAVSSFALLSIAKSLIDIKDALTGDRDELLEWIAGAEHQPGCSGGFPGHRCKCGRRDFGLPWGQDKQE